MSASRPPALPAAFDDVRSPPHAPWPWLVGDIGGTNARLGWVDDASLTVQHVRQLPVAQFAGPAQAIAHYLAERAQAAGEALRQPASAALALATPLDGGDQVRMTNASWAFSRQGLAQDLGLARLDLLNDFEALALALPHLRGAQLRQHGPLPCPVPPQGTLAVIGPGTGLGVAGLKPLGASGEGPTRWLALAGEGGHMTLSAADDFEATILSHARRELAHVSAERLLSGIGLPLLYRCVAAVTGQVAQDFEARDIVEHGGPLQGDALCAQTLDVFCVLLGGLAGNVALLFGATGGIYLGGGILPRLPERFAQSAFRQRFEAKGRYEAYLQAIPTLLITDTLAALHGAAAALQHPAP